MKKAIITGSTGLVGSYVTKKLISYGVDVLCIGRQKLTNNEVLEHFGEKITYIPLEMSEISELGKKAKTLNWSTDDECVFFHFAWSGKKSLTDGDFSLQMNNAVWAADAVKVAKKLQCKKFVNAGSLEETFVERCLLTNRQHNSSQTNYALAKLAARDLCKITAYVEKLDYVHTRMSVPFSYKLSNGYIANTLRSIKKGNVFETPVNQNFFDIISTDDVSRAYYLIGKTGENNSNYFIGTAKPFTLKKFFELSEICFKNQKPIYQKQSSSHDTIFDTSQLESDCGFIALEDPLNLIRKIQT